MTRGYEILEHPSDIGLRAKGKNLAEAFEEAAAGLISIVTDPALLSTTERKEVRIEAPDTDHLLVRWLTEILYYCDAERFLTARTRIRSMSRDELVATLEGETFEPRRHVPRTDVKAITYHQLSVQETPEGAVVEVFVDI